MRNADLDHVAGLSDGSIVLNVNVAIPDPHLPSLQMRNPVSRQTSRAGAVRIERGGRHARKVYAAVSPVRVAKVPGISSVALAGGLGAGRSRGHGNGGLGHLARRRPGIGLAEDGCRSDDLRAWVAGEPYDTQICASPELDRMVVFGPERGWVVASRASGCTAARAAPGRDGGSHRAGGRDPNPCPAPC